MVDRKLIDWIKSQEAKGIGDSKLKSILKRKGWPKDSVDEAINLAHKGKVNWMPLLIAFFVSLILFFVFGLLSMTESDVSFITSLVIMTYLIYSVFVYIKSSKKESFVEIMLINLSSGLFSLVLSALLFNLLVYLVYLISIEINLGIFMGVVFIVLIFYFYLFFIVASKLSTHFVGYFDHESFFVFKHWPFKMFNVDWKKKLTLLKYPLIISLIVLVIMGFIMVDFYSGINKATGDFTLSVTEQIKEEGLHKCVDNLLENQSLDVLDEYSKILIKENGYYDYDPTGFSDVDLIYENCNFHDNSCEQKEFDHNKKIEDQVLFDKDGFYVIKKVETKNKKIVIVSRDYSGEELISCSSSFNDEQLKFKVVQEFEEKREENYNSLINKKFTKITWNNYEQPFIDYVSYVVEVGFDFGNQYLALDVIEHEYELINNQSVVLTDHINKINGNIQILYPLYLNLKSQGEISNVGFSDLISIGYYDIDYILSFDDSLDYLYGNLYYGYEFENKLKDIRNNYYKDKIDELMLTKVEESKESKVIRLKIIETLIGKEIIKLDHTKKKEIIEMTNSPELYEYD